MPSLFGCFVASCLTMNVDAYAGPEVRPELVHQVAPIDSAKWGDLQFQELSRTFENALKLSGYRIGATREEIPDVVILTDFSAGEPQSKVVVRSVPTWVKREVPDTARKTATGDFKVSTTTSHGYENIPTPVTVTSYRLTFTAAAYDFKAYKAGGEKRQLWAVTVTSDQGEADLRRVAPAMMAAAAPYFGKSTGRQVAVTLKEDGPEVRSVKTGVRVTR